MTTAFPFAAYAGSALKLERAGLWLVVGGSLISWLVRYTQTPLSQHNWGMALAFVGLAASGVTTALWQPRLNKRALRTWVAAESKASKTPMVAKRVFQDQTLLWLLVVGVAYLCSREPAWLLYLFWPAIAWSWLFGWRSTLVTFSVTAVIALLFGLQWVSSPVTFLSAVGGLGLLGVVAFGLSRLHIWIARQDSTLEQLQSLASTDALTGLINRRQFNHQLMVEMARARRHRSPLALALFDIDRFKTINDQFGHPMGDRILQELGGLIQQNVREHDVCARYGGEEFALILPETPAEAAVDLMERLRSLIGRTVFCLPDQPLGLTVSVGVAVFQPNEDVMFSFVERADVALYAAKNNGRDQVVFGVEPLTAHTPTFK